MSTDYTPLVLKSQKDGTKTGTLLRSDGSSHYVKVEPGKTYYVVLVDRRPAGIIHKRGVGTWGIQSFDANGELPKGGSLYGYSHRSTLAVAVERAAHGYLTNVEYAQSLAK